MYICKLYNLIIVQKLIRVFASIRHPAVPGCGLHTQTPSAPPLFFRITAPAHAVARD